MISRLNLYVIRLWFVPFLGIFLLVNILFFIQKLTIWLPKLIHHDAPFELSLSLFASLLPFDLTLTLPIAYFFALIKLVRELQDSSELDAMYAGGQSIINIFQPIFWVGVLLTCVMLWLTMELTPAGKVSVQNTAAKLSSLKAEPEFQPKVFVTDIDGFVFYFDGKNDDGSYAQFMLSDARNKGQEASIYFAERATITRTDTGLLVRLFQGSQLSGEKDKVRATHFSNYDIAVPLELESKYYTLKADQQPAFMNTAMLWNTLQKEDVPAAYVAHWHFRLVVALSLLLLFLYAIPLSLQAKRAKQSGVYLIAIGVMLTINQGELILYKKIAHDVLPWWSLWGALGLFALLGAWMFYTVHRRGSMRLSLQKLRFSGRKVL